MAGATTGVPDIGVGAEDTVARAKVAHEVAAPTGPLSFIERPEAPAHVRFGSEADIAAPSMNVRYSPVTVRAR